MATVPKQFRFSEDTLTLMDALAEHLGLRTRADVIRQAVRLLANKEFGDGNDRAPGQAPPRPHDNHPPTGNVGGRGKKAV